MRPCSSILRFSAHVKSFSSSCLHRQVKGGKGAVQNKFSLCVCRQAGRPALTSIQGHTSIPSLPPSTKCLPQSPAVQTSCAARRSASQHGVRGTCCRRRQRRARGTAAAAGSRGGGGLHEHRLGWPACRVVAQRERQREGASVWDPTASAPSASSEEEWERGGGAGAGAAAGGGVAASPPWCCPPMLDKSADMPNSAFARVFFPPARRSETFHKHAASIWDFTAGCTAAAGSLRRMGSRAA